MSRSLVIILAALGMPLSADAAVVLGTAPGFAIDGSTIHSSSIVIDPSYWQPIDVAIVEVRLLGLEHARLGDLVVTLTHVESGRTATLFDSVGAPTVPSGYAAGLDGSYSFRDGAHQLADPAIGNLWSAADAAGLGAVSGGFYYPTASGSPVFASLNAVFGGLHSSGTWRLDFVDTDPLIADGSLLSWVLVLSSATVPAPGAVALLAFAGLAGGRRRRA